MSLRLADPVLEDFVHVTRYMRADEREQWLALTGADEYRSNTLALAAANTPGHRWALIDADNRPVLIGGFEELRPGVWECWQMSTAESWAKHWRAFTKITRRMIRWALANGAHRVQTVALATRQAAHQWYERALGLRCEGRLAGYFATGADGLMYARTA